MPAEVATVFNYMIALIVSLSMHEWAHAYVAYRQGDTTPEQDGRLTLNPAAHLDLFGSLLLPCIML